MRIDRQRAVPDAEARVRALEIAVRHRLDGRLSGDRRGHLPGPGWEAGEGRTYQPGDPVRRIDWNLSARSNSIQVRDTVADRELETWVVVDGSASLDFGTGRWEKRDLAVGVAASFGFLSCDGGSRFGVVVAGPTAVTVHPPGAGREHARVLAHRLLERPRVGEGAIDLGEAIDRVRRLGRRPGALVLVSDLIGDDTWIRPMRAFSRRCHTVVAEVRDPRDDVLPPVGYLTLIDPETGRIRDVQTNDPALRERFAAAAVHRRDELARRVRSSGARHLVVSTHDDWLTDVVRHHLITRRLP